MGDCLDFPHEKSPAGQSDEMNRIRVWNWFVGQFRSALDGLGRVRGQLQNVAGTSLIRFPWPAAEENPQQGSPANDNSFLWPEKDFDRAT